MSSTAQSLDAEKLKNAQPLHIARHENIRPRVGELGRSIITTFGTMPGDTKILFFYDQERKIFAAAAPTDCCDHMLNSDDYEKIGEFSIDQIQQSEGNVDFNHFFINIIQTNTFERRPYRAPQ